MITDWQRQQHRMKSINHIFRSGISIEPLLPFYLKVPVRHGLGQINHDLVCKNNIVCLEPFHHVVPLEYQVLIQCKPK